MKLGNGKKWGQTHGSKENMQIPHKQHEVGFKPVSDTIKQLAVPS